MKFWAVLGSQGCREKKLPNAISMQLFGVVFNVFKVKIFFLILFAHKKLKKPPQKVAYSWQLGVFFLCSPACLKQPRTSFPFYKFFYLTISARIFDQNQSCFLLEGEKMSRQFCLKGDGWHHGYQKTCTYVKGKWSKY